jgi:hypothetical protein
MYRDILVDIIQDAEFSFTFLIFILYQSHSASTTTQIPPESSCDKRNSSQQIQRTFFNYLQESWHLESKLISSPLSKSLSKKISPRNASGGRPGKRLHPSDRQKMSIKN